MPGTAACGACGREPKKWTTAVAELATLLHERTILEERIDQLINRPMTCGHAGERIASRIFYIELEPSAIAKAIDGRFRTTSANGALRLTAEQRSGLARFAR